MKKLITWATCLIVIVVVNFLIHSKEGTLRNGKTVLVRLVPVDPRSLMQGDYMILRYAIAREVTRSELEDKGHIVVSLDEHNVATYIRVYKGESLAKGEQLLFYRNRGGLRLGAESYLFQEGKASVFSKARYGLLKVKDNGENVLAGLCGEDFKKLNEQ